ncbi:nucleotidyltransferase family protein [Candidatus Pacearchaeota archaeon]|nr:nucleotidyltransferase family protein [Candidatus Pacearchaeota archaeon]
MKAILFCGGEGTRLSPLTSQIPKPMIPLQGKTVIEHLFDLFKKYGIKDIILTTCYLKEKFKEYFGNGKKFGVNILYIEEETLLGTANHIALAKQHLNETFLVSNGDELKEIDLEDMIRQHKETKAIATLAIREVLDPSKYGAVRLRGNQILEFVEKPQLEEAPPHFINAGLYIMEPEILKHIPENYTMLETGVFPKLAKEGRLYGYKFKGQWFDTGTFERYEEAKQKWKGLK